MNGEAGTRAGSRPLQYNHTPPQYPRQETSGPPILPVHAQPEESPRLRGYRLSLLNKLRHCQEQRDHILERERALEQELLLIASHRDRHGAER